MRCVKNSARHCTKLSALQFQDFRLLIYSIWLVAMAGYHLPQKLSFRMFFLNLISSSAIRSAAWTAPPPAPPTAAPRPAATSGRTPSGSAGWRAPSPLAAWRGTTGCRGSSRGPKSAGELCREEEFKSGVWIWKRCWIIIWSGIVCRKKQEFDKNPLENLIFSGKLSHE